MSSTAHPQNSAPSSSTSLDATAGHSPLSERHRRLARYLYTVDLCIGKRVLDLDCGDGEGAALLLSRGAKSVLGATAPGAKPAASHEHLTLREVTAEALLQAGGLPQFLSGGHAGAAAGPGFDLIFLPGERRFLQDSALLAALRKVLLPSGHLVMAAMSRETFPDAAHALGYFELIDGLTHAGFGPVAICGQSPFVAAALVPFGAAEPPLVLDDSLAASEAVDEYLALCGPESGSPSRPYEVVRLPRTALHLATAKPVVIEVERVVERVVDRVVNKIVEVEVRVPEPYADPALVAEKERLEAQLRTTQHQSEQLTLQLKEQLLHERAAIEAQRSELQQRLLAHEQVAARLTAERAELMEQLQQREQRTSEYERATLLHSQEMEQLRASLEERDAFVAELEDQARLLPQLHEQLAREHLRAENTEKAERGVRQKLAEVEGRLLRLRGEQQQYEADQNLRLQLQVRERQLEETQRQLLVERADLAEATQALQQKQQALSETQQAAQVEKLAEQQRVGVLVQQLQQVQAALATAEQERQALRGTVEGERHAQQATAQQLVATQAQLAQAHEQLTLTCEQLAATKTELTRAEEQLQQARAVPSGDGVPMAVGDIPTAPIAMSPAAMQQTEELARTVKKNAELEAEVARLKDKVASAEQDSWKYMKARSEAEQAAAEVREDTVRKLRDARKLASVELTRAMEEATRKAVTLREELTRTEAERKEALAQLKELRAGREEAQAQIGQLKAELDQLRWMAPEPAVAATDGAALADELARLKEESAQAMRQARAEAERGISLEREARQTAQQAADEAQSRVLELRSTLLGLETALAAAKTQLQQEQKRIETLEEELHSASSQSVSHKASVDAVQLHEALTTRERSIVDLRAERDALGRLLAEVEREAYARAERARQLRVRLSEREREAEALRAELLDRERRLAALEQQTPPADEVLRISGELATARRRITELLAESSRTDQAGDDAVQTALRERTRNNQLSATLNQTTREREEAQHKTSELEQRLAQVLSESSRLQHELSQLSGHAAPAVAESVAVTPAVVVPVVPESLGPLDASTVQKVKRVGEKLGLEPVFLPDGDDDAGTN
jgi:hypothetical protein